MALANELNALLGDAGTSFGMDFGTSTCVFVYKEGASAPPKVLNFSTVLKTTEIQDNVASLFMRDDDGKEYACDQVVKKNGLRNNPKAVCASIKTKLEKGTICLNGKDYTPRYIAVAVVKRFLEICRLALENEMVYDEIKYIVAGVPVRFDAKARGEMKSILQEATGKTVYLVPEPILAALVKEYYEKKQAARKGIPFVSRDTVTVDVGGGTTDCVVLKPNPKPTNNNPYPFTAHCPDGLLEAGDDMDLCMLELMLTKIRHNSGTISPTNIKEFSNENSFMYCTLRQHAKRFKEQLSSADAYEDNLSFGDFGHTTVKVTREEYEAKIRPLIQRIVDLAEKVLRTCYSAAQPDVDILLVGGATYTPLLTQMLKARFPWLKDRIRQHFPEKAVAMGAAIYAENPNLVTAKVAFGYAVDTFASDGVTEVLQVVIPSDAVLPKKNVSSYKTLNEGQRAVTFHVYEIYNTDGRSTLSMDEGSLKDYSITHNFGKQVPKGTNVSLTATLSEEGLLTMTVTDFLYDSPGPTTVTFNLSGTTPA